MADNILPFPTSNTSANENNALNTAWERILKSLASWLKVNHPVALSRLNRGLDSKDLSDLIAICPEIPDSLVALLKLHNGEIDTVGEGLLFDHYRLLGSDEIQSFRALLKENKDSLTQTPSLDDLIPFAARSGENSGLLCVTPKPHPEAIIEVNKQEVIEFDATLLVFFQEYSTGLRSGQFTLAKGQHGRYIARTIDDKPELQPYSSNLHAPNAPSHEQNQDQPLNSNADNRLDTPQRPEEQNPTPTSETSNVNTSTCENSLESEETLAREKIALEAAAKAVLPEMLLITVPTSSAFIDQQWGDPDLIQNLHQRLIKQDFECLGYHQLEGQIHATLIKHLHYFRDKDRIHGSILELANAKLGQSIGVALEVSQYFTNTEKHLVTWNSTGRYANLSPPEIRVQTSANPIIEVMCQQLLQMRNSERLPLRITRNDCLQRLQQAITYSFTWLLEQNLDLDRIAAETSLFQQLNLDLSEQHLAAFKSMHEQFKIHYLERFHSQQQQGLPQLVQLVGL